MATNVDISYGLAAVNTQWQEGATDFFNKGMEGPMLELTDVVPCDTEYMAFAWLANSPMMADWLGDRIVDMVRAYTFQTRMKPKQATIAFKRKELAYGNLPVVMKQISSFFASARANYHLHMHSKYASNSGVGPTGYDGVALISASHPHGPVGATTQSNSASTTALSYSALQTYDAVMRLFRKENGQSYGMTPTHLMVGPNNATKAKELLGIDRLLAFNASGAEAAASVVGGVAKGNPLANATQLIVNQDETGYHWSILDLSKPGIRPFVMQENRFPEALSKDEMTDDPRWQRDVFQYSLEGDYEGDAGHWQCIIKSTASS